MTTPNYVKNCVTHHYTCDCREEKFKKIQEKLEIATEALWRINKDSADAFCETISCDALDQIQEQE